MASFQNGVTQGVIGRDIDMTLIGQDTRFDLPVRESGAEGKGDILIHGLECLQNVWVTSRSGFDPSGECCVNEVDEEGRRKESDTIVVII